MIPKTGTIATALAMWMLCTSTVEAQNAYLDDFEGMALDSFWTPFTSAGVVTYPSTAQVHADAQSLQLSTYDIVGVNKAAGVQHVFQTPVYGEVDVWMYDTGADVSSSNYFSLHTGPFTVGTLDYDLGPASGGNYQYTVNGVGGDSGIDRTQGWHHLAIAGTATSSRITIDGIIVYTGPGGTPLPEVQLEMHAPWWRPPFVVHFDDFAFTPCETYATATVVGSGCGSGANLPALTASLPVLGQGMTLGVANAQPNGAGLLFAGIPVRAPIVIGSGCEFHLSPQSLVFLSKLAMDSHGSWSMSFSLPQNPLLAGLEVGLQVATLPSSLAIGADLTNGLVLRLGY